MFINIISCYIRHDNTVSTLYYKKYIVMIMML